MSAPQDSLTLALWQSPYAPTTAQALTALDTAAAQASAQGASLLVCPEMSLTGYQIGAAAVAALAEPADGALSQAVAAIAQRHRMAIVYGYPEHHAESKPYNAVQFIDAICLARWTARSSAPARRHRRWWRGAAGGWVC